MLTYIFDHIRRNILFELEEDDVRDRHVMMSRVDV